jgi:hypothetical protein
MQMSPFRYHLRARRCNRWRGFTLIEASLTTVIVGVGFVGMLQLFAVGTMANVRAAETTTAMNLARSVRELSLKTPFAALTGMNGQSHMPPIDSRGQPLNGFSNWRQTIRVQPVDPDRVTLDIADASPSALRITVSIDHNSQRACDVSWYTFDGSP